MTNALLNEFNEIVEYAWQKFELGDREEEFEKRYKISIDLIRMKLSEK